MTSEMNDQRIKASERRRQALDLRKQKKTYREIAEVMGISQSRARQLVADGFKRLLGAEREVAGAVLKQQLDRLDTLAETFWPAASEGNKDAAEVVIKVIDRQARLLGQDAPKRLDATVRAGGPDLSAMSETEIKAHCRRLGIPVGD